MHIIFQASCGVWREDSGLDSRPCRKRRPSSRDDGGVSWVFSSCSASVGCLKVGDIVEFRICYSNLLYATGRDDVRVVIK